MKKLFSLFAALFVAMTMNAQAISVADAISAGMALDSMGVSTEEYTVEGFVINPGSFSMMYMNQSWYMADEASASASDFQAFNCYPIEGTDTLKVLAGDKVQVTGKLKKYYNKNAAKYIIEIEKGKATFVSKAAGDHTIVSTIEEVTVAQALEIGNALANGASTEKQYKIRGYVSAVDVKSSDAYSETYGNQSFYVADAQGSTAASNAEGAFYVYRGKPSTGAAIPYGAYVEFTNTIKKYVPSSGDVVIENTDQNIVITVLEAPEVKYDTLTVAEACEIALALADNESTTQNYAVLGYFAKFANKGEYNTQYKNVSFYMTDDPTSTYGDLSIYRANISEAEGTALTAGDRVLVIGKLTNNYYNDKNQAQIANGSASVEWKTAIENIILTEKVDKVFVDGVLYIVRDGKMYDVRGTQVR